MPVRPRKRTIGDLEDTKSMAAHMFTQTVGADADVTVFDLDCDWGFTRGDTASKSQNNPIYGWPLKGRAVVTIVGGTRKCGWRLLKPSLAD